LSSAARLIFGAAGCPTCVEVAVALLACAIETIGAFVCAGLSACATMFGIGVGVDACVVAGCVVRGIAGGLT
jgi:hypothetical protein